MSMRGASANSSAQLRESLGGLAAEQLPTVGRELAAVADVVRTQASLRRVATDQTVAAEAKAELVQQVFGSQIGAATLQLVAQAAESRWTRARDLADTLETLAVIAIVTSAPAPEQLADELFAVSQLISNHPDLRHALSDPLRTRADKTGLLGDILANKVSEQTLELTGMALNEAHRSVTVALDSYQELAAEVRGQGVALVRVARELRSAEADRLAEALSREYGRPIHVNVVVEPDLLGGIRVEIGDDVIDGSVVSNLDHARRALAR